MEAPHKSVWAVMLFIIVATRSVNASINVLAWTQVSTILLVILGAVFLSEYVSAKVSGALI